MWAINRSKVYAMLIINRYAAVRIVRTVRVVRTVRSWDVGHPAGGQMLLEI